MPIPSTIADLSTTASLNSPAGSDNLSTTDDYLRAIQSIVKTQDNATAKLAGATFTGGINEARGTVTMHATTMDLWAQPNVIDGTGSAVTITAIVNAPQAGAIRTLYPIAGTIITNGATFAVDGAANYTTAAGDALEFEAVTTSTYKVHITKKDGTAVVGATGKTLGQVPVYYSTGAVATGTTLIPQDDTIPQNTEGTQFLTASIIPINANSSLEVEVILNVTYSVVAQVSAALFRDSGANAVAASTVTVRTAGDGYHLHLLYIVSAGSVTSTTFNVRVGGNIAGTLTLNGIGGTRLLGGVLLSSITIKEYLP